MPVGLANGQLPASKQTLYTADHYSEIGFFSLVNTNSGAEACIIYVKPSGGTSRRIANPTLDASGGSAQIIDGTVLMLSVGDVIEGQAADANVVDYYISGKKS